MASRTKEFNLELARFSQPSDAETFIYKLREYAYKQQMSVGIKLDLCGPGWTTTVILVWISSKSTERVMWRLGQLLAKSKSLLEKAKQEQPLSPPIA